MKAKETKEKETKVKFPIVGIGASAGGLEALQDFFDNMPESPGVAFIIIQHLSPDYKSFMSELLSRRTAIPVEVAADDTLIEKNHIYLIPPKMNMTISNGKLYLTEVEGRHLNLPIDIFFRSLALDQENNAIGIILSGTGSDGMLGIRAIKESGGVTMVQDDKTAKFDGMPKSSISTGMVDFILSPAMLVQELMNYVKHPFICNDNSVEAQLLKNQTLYNRFISILHDAKNIDFSNYKQNTIIRRLEKRISINRFERVSDYISYLAVTPKEISALFNDLLIGVTRFFRDESSFAALETIIPEIFAQHTDKSEIRIWIPACSTGEEAYSIAILFKEYMMKNNLIKDVKIFATDIDEESLAYAGFGLYPSNISADVSADILTKYFICNEKGYQINDSIRRMIIFARHNIIDEPPFSKLDLVSCRNMLIYLNIDVQQKILATFHVCMKYDGFLFLGSSESLGKLSEGFDVVNSKAKLYKKRNRYKPAMVSIPTSSPLHYSRTQVFQPQNSVTLQKTQGKQLSFLFEDIAYHILPPSVIVDGQYNILYTIHDISSFIHFPSGQVTVNILKMMDKGLSVIVSSLIRRAEKSTETIAFDNVNLPEGKQVTVSCRRILGDEIDVLYFLLMFSEQVVLENKQDKENLLAVNINDQYQERIEELEREIQQKNENLQATVEELETSNEELQSSNEELIASNEELQSTNEELQSVNEELYTVNSEHLNKIEELSQLNADYDNVLRNTHIGTLFLDRTMVIRKVSDVASKITNVLISDIGRPICHLALDTIYTGFLKDIETVNDSLVAVEKEVEHDGRWYLMRIVPFRTSENAVNGTIITFVDIFSLKKTQMELTELSNRLMMALELGGLCWWEWNVEKNYVSIDTKAFGLLGYPEIGFDHDIKTWNGLIHPDDKAKREKAIDEHIKGETPYFQVDFRIKGNDGKYVKAIDKGIVVARKEGKPIRITGIIRLED